LDATVSANDKQAMPIPLLFAQTLLCDDDADVSAAASSRMRWFKSARYGDATAAG
jgi:hypothetical protein